MSELVPRGVRKISELTLQNGRALILTEEDAEKLNWADIPIGSIKLNKTTGVMSVKLDGQSDWVPAGIKNDGTISIAKDTIVHTETFTIKDVSKKDSDHVFDYINTEGEVRHGRYDTIERYDIVSGKNKSFKGFIFTLEKGGYNLLRNNLRITIDGVLLRTESNGGLVEVNDTAFMLTESLEAGMEIDVEYYQAMRIGNPYPRFFIHENEPATAEVGDIWLDTNATVDDDDSADDLDTNNTIPWNRISGTPTTIKGYGITDSISYKGHRHTTSEINDIGSYVANLVSSCTAANSDKVDGHDAGIAADNVLLIQSDGKISLSNLCSHKHETSDITGLDDKINSAISQEKNARANDIKTLTDRIAALESKVKSLDFTEQIAKHPGLVIMPNGMYLQFGETDSPNGNDEFYVKFPTPFPHAVLSIVASTTNAYNDGNGIKNYTKEGFTWWSQYQGVIKKSVGWIAIGY